MTLDGVNYAVFDAYERELERVADHILDDLPDAGNDTLNGREWCERHDVPESAFADAVNHVLDGVADWGVSPMHPWRIPDEYRDDGGDA